MILVPKERAQCYTVPRKEMWIWDSVGSCFHSNLQLKARAQLMCEFKEINLWCVCWEEALIR